MKATGIVRRVDNLGRIVLPAELRRTMEIGPEEELEIYVEGSSIILKKYSPSCVFCDSCKKILVFRGRNMCAQCFQELRAIPEEAIPDCISEYDE